MKNLDIWTFIAGFIFCFVIAALAIACTHEGIEEGTFDNVAACRYAIPSYWDIGKVYKRLVKMVADREETDRISALIKVYNSFISPKIDDYNSSVYYENPEYIYECYKENEML